MPVSAWRMEGERRVDRNRANRLPSIGSNKLFLPKLLLLCWVVTAISIMQENQIHHSAVLTSLGVVVVGLDVDITVTDCFIGRLPCSSHRRSIDTELVMFVVFSSCRLNDHVRHGGCSTNRVVR